MLNDSNFDTVYFSEYFKNPTSSKDQGLRRIFKDIESILKEHGYEARTLPYKRNLVSDGQLSIWCRDYMPVHTIRRDLLRFSYTPNYLKCKKYEGHEPDNRWVCETLGIEAVDIARDTQHTFIKIILDGGNIVRCGKQVIMTDKIFQENPYWNKERLINYLENWFDASIIWLPYDKRDYLGHSDGIVRYVSGNKVIMAPYGNPEKNKTDRKYDNLYRQILEENGFQVLRLDFSGINEPDDNRWIYTNWLQLKGLIIIPALKQCPRSNERAYDQIKRYTTMSRLTVKMVEADELIKGGGAFNCASWTTTQAAITCTHSSK